MRAALLPLQRIANNISLRTKILVALVSVVILAGAGSLVGWYQMNRLAQTYQREHQEVQAHEDVHEERLALYRLSQIADDYAPPLSPDLREEVRSRMGKLRSLGIACGRCHDNGARQEQMLRLAREMDEVSAMLFGLPAHSSAKLVAKRKKTFLDVAEDAQSELAHIEQHYHEVMAVRQRRSRTAVSSAVGTLAVPIAGSLALAFALAWLFAGTLNRSIMPVLDAARRLGTAGRHEAIPIPRDRYLAPVARALNDVAARVARGIREDARAHLLRRVLASQENERRRIARELHDELGQSLSALLLVIGDLDEGLDPQVREVLRARVKSMIDEVRRMAWGLRPSLLDDHGVDFALERLCAELSKLYELPVDFQAVGFEEKERLPEDIEVVLYRVAQEAAYNTAQHAEAGYLSVVLVRGNEDITLIAEDDGKGFDSSITMDPEDGGGSMGLLGMRERVELVSGSLDIRSERKGGTSVRVRIPLKGVDPR